VANAPSVRRRECLNNWLALIALLALAFL